MIQTNPKLYIQYISSDKGMGVFTNSKITQGEIIEDCYCIPVHLSIKEYEVYFFNFNGTDTLLPLGYGCIYNHNNIPNIGWKIIDRQHLIIQFFALMDIEPISELCHDYGTGYWDRQKKKII